MGGLKDRDVARLGDEGIGLHEAAERSVVPALRVKVQPSVRVQALAGAAVVGWGAVADVAAGAWFGVGPVAQFAGFAQCAVGVFERDAGAARTIVGLRKSVVKVRRNGIQL